MRARGSPSPPSQRDPQGWWTPQQKGWTAKLEHYNKLLKDLKKSTKRLVEEESAETLDYIDAPYNSEGS